MLDVRPRVGVTDRPPPLDTDDTQAIRRWVDDGLYYSHPLRCIDMSEWRRAELYDQGAQWLTEAMAGFEGGSTPAQWVNVYYGEDSANYIPMPVFNEGLGARINESARLSRPNFRPSVIPRSESPDIRTREGSKAMGRALSHRLRELAWEDGGWQKFCYHSPLYGGAYLKSEFVLRWDNLVTVPVLTAQACQQCGMLLADQHMSAPFLGRLAAPDNALEHDGEGGARVMACPKCGVPMQPHQPSIDEAQRGDVDAVGRSLGVQKPLGDWELTVPSPYDVFVRNMGIDQQPGKIREWTEAHVEHLETVGLLWPDRVGDLKPENPAALSKYHPIAGSPELLYSLLDSSLFRDCIRVKERHRYPWMEAIQNDAGEWEMRLNRGRSAVVIGTESNAKVMYYGPLMIDSANYPGQTVERVMLDYVPWEMKDGARRLQGISQWSIMFDPQDASNEIRSQTQAVRKRLALPIYLALTTHSLKLGPMKGVPGILAEYEPDPTSPTSIPQLINNTTIDVGVRYELEDAVNHLEKAGGFSETEKGQPPPGISAGNALALLKGATSERREPRLTRMKAAIARALGHGARVISHMWLEERPVRHGEEGKEAWEWLKGLDFAEQTDVTVVAEPGVDDDVKQQEVVRDMIQIGVVDLVNSSPAQRRRIAKYMKAPEDLFEDDDQQDADAELEWEDFKRQGLVPRVDPGLDDNGGHLVVHGRACRLDEFREKERLGGWDEALKIIGGIWFPALDSLLTAPNVRYQDFQDRILGFWMSFLQALGFQPNDPEAFKYVLTWRAHMEAHRLEEKAKQLRAVTTPELPAPGAPATPSGLQPTPGAPPIGPQPGLPMGPM